jgi:hypothetical protein
MYLSTQISDTKKVAVFEGRLIAEKGRPFTILPCASSAEFPEKLEVKSILLLGVLH